MAAERFQWAPRTTTRIGLWATLGSASIGILLAIFTVQAWTMPRLLALVLIACMLALLTAAVSMILFEVVRACRRFLEHRATSASWVEDEPPGLLDYEADGLRAMKRFTRELGRLGEDTQRLGKKMDKRRVRLEKQPRSARARQGHANRTGKDILKSAVFIQKRLGLFRALVKDINRNYKGLLENLPVGTEEDIQAARILRDALDGGRQATSETLDSTKEYRESVRGLEAQNPSRMVRLASNKLGKSLDGIILTLKDYEKSAAGLVRDFDKRLGSVGSN